MIKTVFAIIGILDTIIVAIKFIVRLALKAEHEGDKTKYQIIKDGDVVWESDLVDEFSYDEHTAFQFFCKEWSKYPGSFAKWERINENK